MGIRRRGIDPAEMAVGATVHHIDAAMRGVPEHDHRRAGHVEFRNRIAHRELLQRGGRFGDDDGREAVDLALVIGFGCGDDVARGVERAAILYALGAMILEAAMVTAESRLD